MIDNRMEACLQTCQIDFRPAVVTANQDLTGGSQGGHGEDQHLALGLEDEENNFAGHKWKLRGGSHPPRRIEEGDTSEN
jgi:hypothetical protein